MSGQALTLLAQLVPLAVVVAWSPVKILPPLALVFGAARPRATSVAYLAGSLISLVGATALFVSIPDALSGVELSGSPTSAWVRIGFGAALLLLACYTWTRRGRTVRAAAWSTTLKRITPPIAAALAVSLTVLNPKVMIATAAAGLAIATAALGTAGTAAAVAGFTALAGSTVIVPVVGYVLAADRVDHIVATVRRSVERHQAVVASSVLAAVGAVLVLTGVVAV